MGIDQIQRSIAMVAFVFIATLFVLVLRSDVRADNPVTSGVSGCEIDSGPPSLTITSPEHGIFTPAPGITVRGQVTGVALINAEVRVNGSEIPLSPNCVFSARIDLDPDLILNPVLVELTALDGEQFVDIRERIVVITGDAIPDGEKSLQSLGIRLSESGLDKLESFITSGVNLDLESLLPPGRVVIDDACFLQFAVPFLGNLCVSVKISISGNPPPRLERFHIALNAQSQFVQAAIELDGLAVDVDVQARILFCSISCQVSLSATTTQIDSGYELEPDEINPSVFDVVQADNVIANFGNFVSSSACDVCFGLDSLAENAIDSANLEDEVETILENFLNERDANGDTPIARAIEAALSDLSIAAIAEKVSERFRMMMDASMFKVAEDDEGLTIGADFSLTSEIGTALDQCMPPLGTAELSASYHIEETFPAFTSTTPQGGERYDLGIAISTSGFNQYLKALTACGFFVTSLEEFDFNLDDEPLPITAGRLGVLIPAFQDLPPETPFVITTRPTLAPLMTGNPSPFGELVELFVGQFTGDIRGVSDMDPSILDDVPALSFAFDFRAGLDVEFDSSESERGLRLIPRGGDPSDVTVGILNNPIGANEALLQVILPEVLFALLPGLGKKLNAFPLPEFDGLQFVVVEISRNDGFISLFVNLVPPAE